MPLGHFHHIVLDVSDLPRSLAFYRDVLGLDPQPAELWPGEGGAPHAVLRTSSDQFVILVEAPEVKPDGPAQHTNFVISAEAYEATAARLRAAGALVADHLVEQGRRPIGEISTYINDPDGRRLQLTAYSDETFMLPAAKKGTIDAGPIADFPIGSVHHNAEGKFYLVHLPAGIFALNQICTHQHCLVAYQTEHYRFWCPCHNRKFTREGEQIAVHQDIPPLQSYAVEVAHGQVLVDTDASVARQTGEPPLIVPVLGPAAQGGAQNDGSDRV
jgi:catechol 2,3-dioxygenase-like lactoylglutathione lyase family enzyme/nitrite reductase/ring-hydroxylating ferredoxin subunit